MRSMPLLLAAALALAPVAHAQTTAPATPTEDNGPVLDTAVVRAPGPGLWKVSSGDHVMWVLGTVSPLPAGMVWNSARVRSIVAGADAVLQEPSVVIDADVGFFGKLALLPSLMGVRDLPDDKQLRDVLPASSYARWTRLKQQYLGSDRAVESFRPLFAGQQLYDAALKKSGLSSRGVVRPAIVEAMKAREMKAIVPTAKLKLANPKAVLKDFKKTDLADVRCFEAVLDRVENDIDTLAARADAWAAGDVATLRGLQRNDPGGACLDAVLGGSFAEKYGMDRLQAQANAKWLAEAETSLRNRRTTLAVLPMGELLTADGLVARLAAKGFVVEAPDTVATTAATAPAAR